MPSQSQLILSRNLAAAIAQARRSPAGRVACLVRSWADVDMARQRIDALGLSGRISVHHRLAAAVLGSGRVSA